jgi:hypothetical protein
MITDSCWSHGADWVAYVSSPASRPSGGKPRLRRVTNEWAAVAERRTSEVASCSRFAAWKPLLRCLGVDSDHAPMDMDGAQRASDVQLPGASAYGRKTALPAPASRSPRRLGFFLRQPTIIRAPGQSAAPLAKQRRRGWDRLQRGFRTVAAPWPHCARELNVARPLSAARDLVVSSGAHRLSHVLDALHGDRLGVRLVVKDFH